MRLFLAIDPPEKIKQTIVEQLSNFRESYPQFDWTPIKNYHITLHFFGDAADEKKIFRETENLLFEEKSFYLYSLNADMFVRHRITMYLNFRREKTLEAITKKIKERFYMADQRLERYVPHLTFVRYRIPSKQQYFVMKKRLGKIDFDFSFHVRKLYFFESILGKKYPIYKKVHTINLL